MLGLTKHIKWLYEFDLMTTSIKIYHNPKCSKSRSALELIQQKQLTVEIIEYLKFPPHSRELAYIIKKLGVTAREIIRKNEEPYKKLGLSNSKLNESELLEAISVNPILLERPIVVLNDKAAIGRPLENIEKIIA